MTRKDIELAQLQKNLEIEKKECKKNIDYAQEYLMQEDLQQKRMPKTKVEDYWRKASKTQSDQFLKHEVGISNEFGKGTVEQSG